MLKKHKVINGKQTCDCCTKKAPPITECSWAHSPKATHYFYMDLCGSCQTRIEGVFSRGGWIGPYGKETRLLVSEGEDSGATAKERVSP